MACGGKCLRWFGSSVLLRVERRRRLRICDKWEQKHDPACHREAGRDRQEEAEAGLTRRTSPTHRRRSSGNNNSTSTSNDLRDFPVSGNANRLSAARYSSSHHGGLPEVVISVHCGAGLVGWSANPSSLPHFTCQASLSEALFFVPRICVRTKMSCTHQHHTHFRTSAAPSEKRFDRRSASVSRCLPSPCTGHFLLFFFWFWIFSPPPRLSIFSIFFCFRVSPPLCFATCCGLCLGPLLSLFLFWLLFERDSTCNPLQLSAFCLLLPRTLASDGLTFTTFCGSPFTLWLAWCGRSALFVRLGLSAGPLARFPAQAMPCFSMPCHAMTNLSCSAWKQQKGEVHRLGHCLGHCACVWWI